MPLYPFQCTKVECGIEEERVCKYSEIENQVCTQCGSPLVKILSAPNSFKFKGVKGSVSM